VDHNVDADVAVVRAISAIPSILEVVCRTTGMRFAAVARVTEDRWTACVVRDQINFGLVSGGELPIKTTLCDEVRASRHEIVIDNVAQDPAYATHHTPQIYGLQSYISVPITLADGSFFGTLCAIDPAPAKLTETSVVAMFRLFAELIGRQIDDQRRYHQSEAQVVELSEAAQLREQFIAVLGHDLRNPLHAFQAGVRLLSKEAADAKARILLEQLEKTGERMTRLVENMLDLARGRLAGGLTINLHETPALLSTLDHIVTETRAAHPTRRIDFHYEVGRAVKVDAARLGQLLSNLLGNAVAYGAEDQAVQVHAGIVDQHFFLSVANAGSTIPADVLERLFQPFYRGKHSQQPGGLGLGLFIASQIALAHNGRLEAASKDGQTKFTFTMLLT
jgi:signal transduction histidine kinase